MIKNTGKRKRINPIKMETSKVYEELKKNLGFNGRMISASKSGYHDSNPGHLVVFNANIIVIDPATRDMEKVWYGDVDLTSDEAAIIKTAESCNVELRVLYEMDARFENENKPRIDKFVYKYPDAELGTNVKDYYEWKDGKLARRDSKK